MSKRVFLTTADVSPWTVPADWSSSNTIECIGGGAGTPIGGSGSGGGGGGGAYAKIANLALTPGGSVSFGIGGGGGGAGGDTFFNGLTLAASSVGAQGGQIPAGTAGGSGGLVGSSIGSTRFAGGSGGSQTGGGGGAAGLHGAGQNGANGTGSSGTGGAGGAGDAGFGGAGGAGTSGSAATGGSAGTQWDATHGSGGGGGGSATSTAGSGAGFGGGAGNGGDAGGTGAAGLIVITYLTIPEIAATWNVNTNIPARFGRNNIYAGSGSTFAAVLSSPQTTKGWFASLDYKFAKRFPVGEQQFSGFQPRGLVPTPATPQGWQGDFGAKFRKRVPAFDNQFFTSLSLVQPPSAPSLYWGYDAWNVTLLPIPVTEHEFSVLPFRMQPTVATPQGWQGDFGFQLKKPISPVLQQFISTRLQAPPSRDTIAFGLSANDVVLLPLEVVYQPFAELPFQQVPTEETPQGWQGDFGFELKRPLSVAQQPFIGFTPQGLIPTVETPQGWPGDIGVAHVKPLSVTQQPFFTSRIGQIPTVPTPIGGFNVTPTYAFKKPTPVTEHQFSALSFIRPPSAASPHGWETRLDVKFAKRTPVTSHPFLGFFTGGNFPTAPTPQGWRGYQPAVTIKPLSAALQLFEFFQPQGFINVHPPDQVQAGPDPYIYPGDKKAKAEREKILGPYDPRKLSRKQRKLIAQLEAQRWEQLTAGPTREQQLHDDMQRAIAEVLEKAEKKRIEDAKVGGLFAEPPAVALEASLHATIRVVRELEAQQALDDARKAIARRKQEALERTDREAREAEERVALEARAARKAKKAAQDARLLAKYRMKKRMEASEIHDAVFDVRKPSRLGLESILDEVIDTARRKK